MYTIKLFALVLTLPLLPIWYRELLPGLRGIYTNSKNIHNELGSRHSGIRFTVVPPSSTIYKNSKNIERTVLMGKN